MSKSSYQLLELVSESIIEQMGDFGVQAWGEADKNVGPTGDDKLGYCRIHWKVKENQHYVSIIWQTIDTIRVEYG